MSGALAHGDGADEVSGVSFGRYRIHRRIASGGMANIYLASFRAAGGFSKLVALKRVHDHLVDDGDFSVMFLDEARIAARITHPNVCQVFDFGEERGSYFLAMEYLIGETFREIPRAITRQEDRRPWFAEVATLCAQAAEGLHAAHTLTDEHGQPLGIVHRDVSPHNLFVTFSGCVKVMDFGIARSEGRSHETRPGVIKGKFGYVAPEQALSRGLDCRADVWGLGVTLWEMLTLRGLFRRQNEIETLRAVLRGPIPRPSSIEPTIPDALDEVVMTALSRDPAQRFATARDFSRALTECVRSMGGALGAVEIEDWLKTLFADELDEKRALEREALEGSMVCTASFLTPAAARGPSETSAVPGTHVRLASDSSSPPPVQASGSEPAPAPEEYRALGAHPVPVPESAPRRSGIAAAALAAAVAAAVTTGVLLAAHPEATPLAREAVDTPSARGVEPAPSEAPTSMFVATAVRSTGASAVQRPGAEGSPAASEAQPAAREPERDRPTERARGAMVQPGERAATAALERARTARVATPAAEPNEPPSRPSAVATSEANGATADARDTSDAEADAAATPSRPAEAEAAEPVAAPAPADVDAAEERREPVRAEPRERADTAVRRARVARTTSRPAPPPVREPPPALEARASLRNLSVEGSLPPSVLERTVRRHADDWGACYRASARRAGRDQAGHTAVQLTLDEMGSTRSIRVRGEPLPGIARCVARSVQRMRSRIRPDTGRDRVSFEVHFTPVR